MKKQIFLLLVVLLLIFCVLYGFQKQQKLFPPERHEVEVRLVLVDVIVTKGGEFVTDLTKDDFELYEDGVKVPINSMDLISLEKGEVIVTERKGVVMPGLPQREKRLIVIFDSINTIRRELERSKPEIIEKLISLFKLGREIMVLELTEKDGMRVLQPFTRDEELLSKAVKKASGSIWVEKSTDELGKTPSIEDEAASGQVQVKRDQAGKLLELEFLSYGYFLRIRFEKTINGLLALMNTIKDYPGRKTILLISGGIPYSPVGYRSRGFDAQKIFDPFNLLNKPGVRGKHEILDALIHFANSQNITFYALDPDTYIKYLAGDDFVGSFRREEKLNELHNLNWLAKDTGGESLKGAKRFENFYQVVKRDLTYYYELSFYPRRKEADGEYHKLQVKVKRPGIKIRFRKGYSDYSDDQKEILLFASASYNPSLFKQIPFKAQAIPFAQGKNKFILWMNLALPVKKLILETAEEIPSKILRLNFWVKDPSYENTFIGQINIPLNLTPSFLKFIKKTEYLGYNLRTPELKLKKDKYQVVFALYDEKTGEIGTAEQTLINPDLKSASQPKIVNSVLGTLSEEIEKGIKHFAISKKEGTLQLSKHKFYPIAVNHLRQDQTIGVFLQIHFPKEEVGIEPQFSLYQKEKEVRKLSGVIVDKHWNGRAKIWSGVFNLDIIGMLPGDYLLKIEVPILNLNLKLEKEVELKIR